MRAKPFTLPMRPQPPTANETLPKNMLDEDGLAFDAESFPPAWRGPGIQWPKATPPEHKPFKVKE